MNILYEGLLPSFHYARIFGGFPLIFTVQGPVFKFISFPVLYQICFVIFCYFSYIREISKGKKINNTRQSKRYAGIHMRGRFSRLVVLRAIFSEKSFKIYS